jgi:hypothetical protein
MAEKKYSVSFEVEGKQAEESVKSIKSQLKDAKNELFAVVDKFGELSPQAAKAATKVAQLEDKIGDAKKLSDAFNPDAKFKGLSNAIQGAVGAFTALQGAQALFGSESKEVQQTLAKVQGALALSQGVNAVLDAKDSIKALGAQLMSLNVVQKVVTAAQWAWNIAMEANPIGALVAAIAAVIAGIVLLVKYFKDSAAEAKAQSDAVNANTKALENQNKTMERQNEAFQKNLDQRLAMAKASGKSAEEIRKLELKLIDEKIAYERSAKTIAYQTYEKERNYLATLKAQGADEETIKKQLENVKKAAEAVNKQTELTRQALNERVAIQNRHEVERTQAQTDGAKKRIDENKKEEEEKKNANKAAQEAILKLQQELAVKRLADEKQSAELVLKQNYENAVKDIENSKANEKLKQEQLKLLKDKYDLDQAALDKKKKEDEQKLTEEYLNKTIQLTRQIELNGITDKYEQQKKQIQFNYEDQRKEIEKNETISAERKLVLLGQLQTLENQELDKLKKDKAQEDYDLKIAQYDKDLQAAADNSAAKMKILEDERKFIEQQLKDGVITEKQASEAKVKILKTEKDIRKQLIADIIGILKGFADVVGTQTKAGKAAAKTALIIEQAQAVSSIITNTQEAVMKDNKNSPATYGLPWSAVHIAQGALGVAKSIKAVKKGIADINGANENSSGSSGGDVGSVPAAPIAPTPDTTILPQAQIDQIASANAATRAYVVESDVSSNQERIVRLNRAARIG